MRRALLLALLALPAMGPDCGGGGAAAPVSIAASPTVFEIPVGTIQSFDLQVQSSVPIQAFELDVEVQPPNAVVVGVVEPGAGFDDDGRLFVPPQIDVLGGTISRIVDVRHGAAAGPGTFTALRFSAYAIAAGDVTVRFVNARFAKPDGSTVGVSAAPATLRATTP